MNHLVIDFGNGASLALSPEQAGKASQALIAHLLQQSTPKPNRYRLGESVPGQGGTFAGDILGNDGVIYGLIDTGIDIDPTTWGPEEELTSFNDWDGLSNTNKLRDGKHPIADQIKGFEADGHTDLYVPAQRELMVARANVPHLFKKSLYWTSTPFGSDDAWAVTFEYGTVLTWFRGTSFRVRLFRRFIA